MTALVRYAVGMTPTSMSDRALLELSAAALFVHDAAGRIVRRTTPDGQAAPQAWLARSRGGSIIRVRADVSETAAAALVRLAAGEPPLPEPVGGPSAALWWFMGFYVTCVALTWFFYTRRGGLLRDIERGLPLPPVAAQPAE